MQRADLCEFVVGDARRGKLARMRFEIGHHLKGVDHILLAKRERNGATVRQQLDEALRGQHLDRLAQRRARDLKLLAKLALIQLGTGRNGAFDQHAAQPGGRLMWERLAGEFDDFGHALFLHTN